MYKHPIAFLSVYDLTMARYAAAMHVDYIGFCFDNANENFITVAKAKEIMGWIRGVKFIGEFYSKPADEIAAIALELNLDMVLLHGNYAPADMESIPCEIITVPPNPYSNYLLADEYIFDRERNVFAVPVYCAKEDETGVIDFTEMTQRLDSLEIKINPLTNL